jgi:hypothetical protein
MKAISAKLKLRGMAMDEEKLSGAHPRSKMTQARNDSREDNPFIMNSDI